MNFNVTLRYLGAQENTMKDGTKFYKVSFFDLNGAAPVQLNVMADREEVLKELNGCQFGTVLDCNFSLVAKDNLYRLVLVTCTKSGK